MADEHAGGGGSPYTFLFLLAGAMLAAVAFKAIHTGIPLTTVLEEKSGGVATVSSAPIVSTTTPAAALVRKKKSAVTPHDHWTTVTLDQNGRVLSVIHY